MAAEMIIGMRVDQHAALCTNADLLPHIFELYVPEGSRIADVTYGWGAFWRNIDQSRYELLATDLMTGVDFCDLPTQSAALMR